MKRRNRVFKNLLRGRSSKHLPKNHMVDLVINFFLKNVRLKKYVQKIVCTKLFAEHFLFMKDNLVVCLIVSTKIGKKPNAITETYCKL